MNENDHRKEGTMTRYSRLAVGTDSLFDLIRYEMLTGLLSSFPGGIGYLLRRKLYSALFRKMGRGVSIGRNVTLRCPGRIHLGKGVLIEDNCSLDARGDGAEIVIGDGVIVSRNTIIRCRSGSIVLGEGSSIGANCILGTDSRLTIGRDVLIAAYCYFSGGGPHNFDDLTVPIIRQGVNSRGGITVGDGAWVGAQTVVLDGSQIGEGAIVGAKSLVKSELPPRSIAYGIPAAVQRIRGEKGKEGSPA